MHLNRKQRAKISVSTISACNSGHYQTTSGRFVNFSLALKESKDGTVYYDESASFSTKPKEPKSTRFELSNEGSLQAAKRLVSQGLVSPCVLNFASARNPGGGFLRGSLAQEESLCMVSGLYPCLLCAPSFYTHKTRDPTYTHRAIFTPRVPVIRSMENGGEFIEEPFNVSFITAAAVNAGVCQDRGMKRTRIVDVMKQRVRRVLDVAISNGVDALVLCAWGCGVFRNSPADIASTFAKVFAEPRFREAFNIVVFAIKGDGRCANYCAFEAAFRAVRFPFVAVPAAARVSEDAVACAPPPGISHVVVQMFDYFAVLDFEATCDDKNPPKPQEIIEFPVVLMDARTFKIVDEFHRYVRPTHFPALTPFCRELTGIEQSWVDSGDEFAKVLADFEAFLAAHGLLNTAGAPPPPTLCFVTCGDWDLRKMLPLQCATSSIAIPPYMRRWVNIKREFNRTCAPHRARGMANMLKILGLELIGRHHSGIDDGRNIARIVNALCKVYGARLRVSSASG